MKYYFACIFFLFYLTAQVSSQSLHHKIETYSLDNGLEVYFVNYGNLPVANIDIFIGSGKIDETPGLQSLAEITGEGALLGNTKWNRIEQDNLLASLGTEIGASSNDNFTHISTRFSNEDIDTGFGLLASIIIHPTFDTDEIRELINQMIEISKPSFMDIGQLAMKYANLQVFGSVNPLGRSAWPAQLKKIDTNMVKQFHQFNFTPKNTKIFITGKFEKDSIKKIIFKNFSGWSSLTNMINDAKYPVNPIKKKEFAFVNRNNATQSCLVWSKKSPYSESSDLLAFLVSQLAFNKVLFEDIREKRGKTYGIYSIYDQSNNNGIYSVRTQTRYEETYNTILAFDSTMMNFYEQGISHEYLAVAKTNLKNRLLSIQDPSELATFLQTMFLKDMNNANQYFTMIDQITPEEVNKIIKKYYKPDSYKLMIAGDEKLLESQLQKIPDLMKIPLNSIEVDQ